MAMYKYSAFSQAHSIRVIELLPSRKKSESLSIRLKEVLLDGLSVFEAVLYSWEGQSPDQGIVCDGQEPLITATCQAALLEVGTYGCRTLGGQPSLAVRLTS